MSVEKIPLKPSNEAFLFWLIKSVLNNDISYLYVDKDKCLSLAFSSYFNSKAALNIVDFSILLIVLPSLGIEDTTHSWVSPCLTS